MSVAADQIVKLFRDPNYAGNPKEQRHGNQERHAHSHKPEATRATINFSILRHAMNGFQQLFASELRHEFRRARVGNRQEMDDIEPIEPSQEPHLESAERAAVVVEDEVCSACFAGFHAIKYRRLWIGFKVEYRRRDG